MKKLSIKFKITLWNAFLMILMVTLVLGFMMTITTSIIEVNGKKQLTRVVNENADEVDYEDGVLEIEEVVFFEKGVYTMLFNLDGTLLYGNPPNDVHFTEQLSETAIKTVNLDGTEYYIYDKLIYIRGYENIWIRGMIEINEVANVVNTLLIVALILSPILIFLATLGCYYITKRAMKPIDKIIDISKEISESEDLSLRIKLGKGNDEVHKLANTFDKMFDKLESSFESEKQFSSDASHELRTPTAVILAQCEYARGNKSTDDDKDEALEVIQRQAFKMSKLISDLLNINRLDRGIEKVDFQMTNLSELLTNICEEENVIAPSNIKFSYEIESNINMNLDQSMIIRLVTNLINNAFKYNREQGTVTVKLLENHDEIILTVEDNGIGISKHTQDKIWQRFYQVNPSRTAEQNGSMGLGLFMTKQIAEIHGANINVKSELNIGSCFTVKFKK